MPQEFKSLVQSHRAGKCRAMLSGFQSWVQMQWASIDGVLMCLRGGDPQDSRGKVCGAADSSSRACPRPVGGQCACLWAAGTAAAFGRPQPGSCWKEVHCSWAETWGPTFSVATADLASSQGGWVPGHLFSHTREQELYFGVQVTVLSVAS